MPANGEQLTTFPSEIRLTFTRRINVHTVQVELIGPDSEPVATDAPLAVADFGLLAHNIPVLGKWTINMTGGISRL